jgi:ERCC4-related helicase
MDDDYFDDPVFDDAAFLDQVECSASVSNPQPKQQPQQQQYNEFGDDDDFGDAFDDDLDLEELVQVEQQVVNNDGNISFVSCQDDPIPPPALPEHTASYHPLNVENLRTWIYPTNYPIRGYQLNIVQKALFNNTLVALPTGLGKTFIAAVVMYNYWRWFPNSKIIFMAPTRPLVTQQIEACFTICGLPQDDTTDMSGSVSPAKRRELWKSKRVFFTTPQTVQNDLVSRSCPAENVVCIVVDEAHKATGNYAYSEVVRKLSNKHQEFRVLALTATPGKDMDVVQNVVDNLKITNIQIRTEDSMDIRQFTHGKNVEKVIVPLNYTEGSSGMLPSVIYDFKTKIFQPMLNQLARKPSGLQISDADRVATYALTASRARFNATAHNLNNGFKFQIMSMYLVCEQMSRAFDMLRQHGIAPFVESIENTRQELEETIASGKKMNSMQSQYYNNPAIKKLLTDLKREMIKPDFIGHPKIDQLVATLLKHFVNLPEGTSSKVMIFSSFRSSVSEICRVLNKHSPMVRASFFVGQSESKNGVKGLKQYEQQEVR